VGDFNGDRKADLVVVNQASNTMSVLLGKGDGTFQPRTDYATGASPAGVAVGDFNCDGKLDVAVANKGANSVSILLGNGDGTFGAKTDIALPLTPVALTVGDFNGDGKADIAVATFNATQDSATMLRGNGDGTFQLPVTTVSDTIPFVGGNDLGLAGTGVSTILSGDFNGDGHADLVVVNNEDIVVVTARARFGGILSTAVVPEPGTVSVLLGNGDGTLQAPRTFAVGSGAESVAIGDFNNDGRPDFAVDNSASGSVSVFTNSGNGNFSESSFSFGIRTGTLVAGDFNGDGVTDLAVGANILIGQTGTGLHAGARYALPLSFPVAADFNGDGHLDLAGLVGGASEVWLNNSDGTFPAPILISGAGITLAGQATGDFNGDGIPDLVSASTGQVQLGLGDGRFGDPITLPFPGGSAVSAVDADGNGTVDVLVSSTAYPTGLVAAWLNSPGYDNRTGGAVGFIVSAPTQIVAGANASVTVTAVDALGNPVPGFLGTVDLDNTPAGSTALNFDGQYSFTAADNGRHTFFFSNLTKAGADTLSVFAVGMPTATAPLTVVPAAMDKFVFSAPFTIPAGTPFSFAITADDQFGNIETGYTGTVHFNAESQDTQASVPADYMFTAADDGTHSFTATLTRTQTDAIVPLLTATDTLTRVTSSQRINFTPLAATRLSVSPVPSSLAAGAFTGLTVTALDVYGNIATGFADTIHFSSTDPRAAMPADFTFTPDVYRGSAGFGLTFVTAGIQSLTVIDTSNPAFANTQSGIVVVPAAPTTWVFTGLPASSTAGATQSFTLSAFDPFGNLATNYFGRVHFTSSDGQAVLPADYSFTTADAGSHTFAATLKTAGNQTITVTDTANPAFTGSLSLAVTAAAAASFSVAGFPATTAGVVQTFTVTLRDAFGNIATGYTGTVAVTSSDPIASLPANYTFTSADAGVHTFTAALKRAGTQSLQVADTLTSSLIGAENGIVVSAAAVTHFAISGPTSVTQGVGFKITVSAVDDFGNVNAGYRGTVDLSSTDATGGTQNFTFSNNDNGVHIFSYTFNALGLQTITIADTTNSAITGAMIIDVVAKSSGGGGGGGGGTGGP
jgi:hypothetical protein